MLSEHETLELLEQLKLGVLTGTTDNDAVAVDTVGHWPVLIGGGMCLNLQAVAALELNSQPEYIYVTPSDTESVSCADLASRYQLVHHLSTGVDDRTIVLAYDKEFSSMLSMLDETDNHSAKEYFQSTDLASVDAKTDAVTRQHEFSQAIVASIDHGPAINGQPVGYSFLALDAEEQPLVGSWQLQLCHGDMEARLFIGLVNSHFDCPASDSMLPAKSFSITVRPKKISRISGVSSIVAELAQPRRIKIEEIKDGGDFPVVLGDGGMESPNSCPSTLGERSMGALVVQRMLQLSVDDLNLLIVEAIGMATQLTFTFQAEAASTPLVSRLLCEGARHRCLTVNGLLVREAYLVVSGGKCLLKSSE